jgi:hypothetical protein
LRVERSNLAFSHDTAARFLGDHNERLVDVFRLPNRDEDTNFQKKLVPNKKGARWRLSFVEINFKDPVIEP